MTSNENGATLTSSYMWTISKGRHVNLDLDGLDEEVRNGARMEYSISELAKYMLSPRPVQVEKKLVGCEIHYPLPSSKKIRGWIRRVLPNSLVGLSKEQGASSEVLMSGFERERPLLRDRNLESHVNRLYELLRPYDAIHKELSGLDSGKVCDVVGICEDISGNRSFLTLQGGIDEKINYMKSFISKDVRIVLEKAYLGEGLFEMMGFDFRSYDPKESYRLIKLSQEGREKYCVLDSDGGVEYWVDNPELVRHIHLLEQSIRTNIKFNNSLELCAQGNARPLKLLFYKPLEIDYSKGHLPKVYRDVFEACNMGRNERDLVVSSLKNLQFGISFNYVPLSDSGEARLFTNISVMHDFRALESIKDNLPSLYAEINKRTFVSDAGKFYLLDSIRGFRK